MNIEKRFFLTIAVFLDMIDALIRFVSLNFLSSEISFAYRSWLWDKNILRGE
jgi:hypothetical protein